MIKKKKINVFLILIVSIASLFISFVYNEDGHGNGGFGDFRDTWGYIEELKNKNIFEINPISWTRHFPLHYYFISIIGNLIENKTIIRLIYLSLATSIPLIFYKTILLKNEKYKLSNVQILSILIFLIPAFRYLSIWANAHITAIFFFLLSIYFFFKYEKSNKKFLFLIIHILFIFLSAYSIQYYAIFGVFFFFHYFKFEKKIESIFIIFLIILFSIPGLYFINLFPDHFSASKQIIYIPNIILGNAAMISIYILPILLINIIYNKQVLKKRETTIVLFFSVTVVLLLIQFFDPTKWVLGGGIPLAFSTIIFKNYLFFYFCAFVGIFGISIISKENINNLFLGLISIFLFMSNTLYQRYYEPLFYIMFFLLFKTKFTNIFKKKIKYSIILLVYYLVYYLLASSEILYFFK